MQFVWQTLERAQVSSRNSGFPIALFAFVEFFDASATQPNEDRLRTVLSAVGPTTTRARQSILARVLGIVTEVRPAEVATALLLTLNSFLLLSAYACIKPVREAFILALPQGAEYKIYMAAATAVTLLVAVPVYAQLATRLARNRLLLCVTLFFASHLILFYAAGSKFGASRMLGLGFYPWDRCLQHDDRGPVLGLFQ